ncbi:AAA family ATPase [Thiobacillus denitrificans]|uniref:Aminoglycoside phosphotransferase n=1 Tax=Thiobacillus denitrificans TaxID=36861 RepID=A0A106BJP7_THIDE|nr:bifunctional aminoglycoside phosphotransferase/ATP-binding protein [Thiobacillus denitrificans]KVW93745.1 aminoglycoside phosphotransferase [Thiobacillus denitrificans]
MPEPKDDLPQLIRSLHDPACYDHAAGPVRLIETHISWVLLTGEFAYKIKKPLDLGFLDFSSLDKRLHVCCDEVQLNRRLAPAIYLDVVPITGTPAAPRVNGTGETFEYAVKMRQFPPDATLDRLDAQGGMTAQHVDAIAATVARFHREGCARATADSPWGSPEKIWQPVAQNFVQISSRLDDPADRQNLDALQCWSEAEHARLAPLMAARKRDGFVRECHGDLHLGNLAWVDDHLLVFDCIEFNPELRWIDIQSEVAFCYMDLLQRGHADWAWLFLNGWLERTGDYAGIALLRYYAVYRALVRAKVSAIRSAQTIEAALAEVRSLLKLATTLTQIPLPRLDITHGLSGSGKTTVTQKLLQTPGAIRLRSDIERKRLAGLDALVRSGSGVGQQLYAADATPRTYDHLACLAGAVLDAGWPVIVDATFIARWQRDLLRELAQSRGVAFHILDLQVPVATLRERIIKRAREGSDASEAGLDVLQHQLDTEEALAADEKADVVSVGG